VATSATGATSSPSVAASSSATPTIGAVAGITAGAPPPASHPGSISAGGWAASALGLALVGSLVFQVVRLRRRPSSRLTR
jgi:hypothetical protein